MKSRSFSPCLMEEKSGHPHSQTTISFPEDSLTASPPHPSFSGSYGVRPHLGLQNCELSSLLQPLCGGSVCGVPVGVCVCAHLGWGKKKM